MALDGVGERDLVQHGGVELTVQTLDLVLALSDGGVDLFGPCRQSSAKD